MHVGQMDKKERENEPQPNFQEASRTCFSPVIHHNAPKLFFKKTFHPKKLTPGQQREKGQN